MALLQAPCPGGIFNSTPLHSQKAPVWMICYGDTLLKTQSIQVFLCGAQMVSDPQERGLDTRPP